ncbi:hypothetical protein FQR65_LT04671 [Abscondita terminalis]|nr:hypothetical protein FQR65_LT04671 [Abscondita terminalis]
MNTNVESNLTTDAEPTVACEGKEQQVVQVPQQLPIVQNSSLKKKTKTKIINNVINIENSQSVHFGKIVSIYAGKKQKNRNCMPQIALDISKLRSNNEQITDDIINIISTHIGKNWKRMCRTIGYSEGQIFQFEDQHIRLGIRETVCQILNDWRQNNPEESTVGVLVDALYEAEEMDVVQRLGKAFSNS